MRKHPLRLLYLAVALGPRPRFPTEKNLKRTGRSTLLPVMAHGGPIPKHILPQSELWDLSRHWTTGRPVQNGRTLSNVPIQRTKTGKANIESRFGRLYNKDDFTDRGEGSPLLTVWESCAPCPCFKQPPIFEGKADFQTGGILDMRKNFGARRSSTPSTC